MDNKVNYKQIEIANSEMNNMKLGSKEYAPVNERIKAFRKVYPTGSIITEIENQTDDSIQIVVTIKDGENILAVARAKEVKSEKGINASRMIENCETSAVGRALGMCGFGVDTAVASAEDMEKADESKTFQIAKGITISVKTAIEQARLTINELYKKMGMRVQDINDVLEDRLWTSLADMNVYQLLKLESELKRANMESSSWHNLYNLNTKAKEVIPINQEVIYKSTWRRFGEMALQLCGTNELKRQDVIDEYMEMEIDLGATYEK